MCSSDLLLSDLAAVPAPALQDALVTALEGLGAMLLDSDVPASWVRFYLTAQAAQGEAFERIFERATVPVQQALTTALARLMGRPIGDEAVTALAFVLVQQYVCLRLADQVLLRRLNWDGFTHDRVRQLLSHLAPYTRAQLACAARVRHEPVMQHPHGILRLENLDRLVGNVGRNVCHALAAVVARTRTPAAADDVVEDRKSTRLNSSHVSESRMPSSA